MAAKGAVRALGLGQSGNVHSLSIIPAMRSIGTNANRQGSKSVYTGRGFLDMFLFEHRDMDN